MMAVFRRELGVLMRGMTGWLIMASAPLVFMVMTAFHLLSGSAADYIRVITDSTIAYGFVGIVYAAQGFAKDRRMGANRRIHALPISAPE